MKYFTRGWHSGEISNEEAVKEAYWKHIEDIAPHLPPSVAELAKTVNLHDAVIEQVRVNEKETTLTLSLVCTDAQAGYSAVSLEYLDVQIGDAYREILKDRARDRETELLYDEIDIEQDGLLVHRLLFWPVGEISIWFHDLTLTRTMVEDKRVRLGGYFWEES